MHILASEHNSPGVPGSFQPSVLCLLLSAGLLLGSATAKAGGLSAPLNHWGAWGAGGAGQTGDPHFGQSVIPNLSFDVVDISAGHHNAALKADGTVYCWGRNDQGQCDVPAGLKGVKQVAAGHVYTMSLLADGSVAHWGFDGYGMRPIPAAVTNVVAVAAGYSHCLALRGDGQVLAWGYNGFGQTNVPGGLSNVVAIAAGNAISAVLRADGTVVTWGIEGSQPPAGLGPVREIACGSAHVVALLRDGTVRAWGNSSAPTAVIVPGGLTNVMQVAAGTGWSVALKNDGSLISWGDGEEPVRLTYGQTVIPAKLGPVRRMRAGIYHILAELGDPGTVLALDTDGDAFTDGMEFRFGYDHRDARSFPPFPVFDTRSLRSTGPSDFRVRVSVPANSARVTIETSANGSTWAPLVSFPSPRPDLEFVDPTANEATVRLYRAILEP
jgi:alpha-tubulin suppressor-like RCC1 family protein